MMVIILLLMVIGFSLLFTGGWFNLLSNRPPPDHERDYAEAETFFLVKRLVPRVWRIGLVLMIVGGIGALAVKFLR
ncbi:MAG: hypothetical protein WD770_09730 [Actinomycetota bacterium]